MFASFPSGYPLSSIYSKKSILRRPDGANMAFGGCDQLDLSYIALSAAILVPN